MIRTGDAAGWQHCSGEFAKTALHPVSHDGAANFLGNRIADPNRRIAIVARLHQQHEAGRRNALARIGAQEICALTQRGEVDRA